MGYCDFLLSLESLLDGIRGERLGTLDGEAERTIPDELRQDTQSTRNTKQDCVVILFRHSIVLQKDTTVSIHVGPWVLGLSMFGQHVGNNVVELGDQLEQGVRGQVLQSKFALASVTRVRLAQYSVTVSRDNLER